jgi:hypothetical protein
MIILKEDQSLFGEVVGNAECFYCGGKIEQLPCIFWHGNDSNATLIYYHASCAGMMASHLQSDFTRLLARNDR